MHIPSHTLVYLAMILGLLVVPRALQRFRLPAPLTCFIFGIVGAVLFKTTVDSQVLRVLATLGVASLFLLAGLEVDLVEIRRQLPRLMGHLGVRGVFLIATAWLAIHYLHMSWQPASLLGLGLLTPSTGFILDTLPQSGLKAILENCGSPAKTDTAPLAKLIVMLVCSCTLVLKFVPEVDGGDSSDGGHIGYRLCKPTGLSVPDPSLINEESAR